MNVVVYYRHREPGRKAYGLDPARQRRAVNSFIEQREKLGETLKVIAEFIEIECDERPVLQQAIEKTGDHLLLIASSYRMTVNVRFLLSLRDVNFAVADNPLIHSASLSSYLAEARSWATKQSQIIRQRMKGVACGAARKGHFNRKNEHLRAEAVAKATEASAKARTYRMVQAYSHIIPTIERMLQDEETYNRIADRLNEMGFLTTAGKPFRAGSVHRIYKDVSEAQGTTFIRRSTPRQPPAEYKRPIPTLPALARQVKGTLTVKLMSKMVKIGATVDDITRALSKRKEPIPRAEVQRVYDSVIARDAQ